MTHLEYKRRTPLPTTAEEAFAWHLREGAFDRLKPPFDPVRVESRSHGTLADGDEVVLRVGRPIGLRWTASHDVHPSELTFRDVQVRGPFARWEHTHRFVSGGTTDGPAKATLADEIEIDFPLGPLGRAFGTPILRRKLDRMFAYRERMLTGDLGARATWAGPPPSRVLVTGATGLVGRSLVAFLRTRGDEVLPVGRTRTDRAPWFSAEPPSERSPETSTGTPAEAARNADLSPAGRFDALVHLAGENIAARHWSTRQRARIRDSRVHGTRRIAEAVAAMPAPPKVLVCASAIGMYGDRGDEELTERSPAGDGFLPDVCREWEEAALPAAEAGIRVVHVRIGLVLTPAGGALGVMLLPFRFGVGGRLGSGRQWMSWISIESVSLSGSTSECDTGIAIAVSSSPV